MKKYLVIYSKSFTFKTDEKDFEDVASEKLWDIDPDAELECVEEI